MIRCRIGAPIVLLLLSVACGSSPGPTSEPTDAATATSKSAFEELGVSQSDVPAFKDEFVRDKAPEVYSTVVDESAEYTEAERRAIAASIIEARRPSYDLIVIRFFRAGTEDELAGAAFVKTQKAADSLSYYGFKKPGTTLPTVVFRNEPPV